MSNLLSTRLTALEIENAALLLQIGSLQKDLAAAEDAFELLRGAFLEAHPDADDPTALDLVGWIAEMQPRDRRVWSREIRDILQEHGIGAQIDGDGESVTLVGGPTGEDGEMMMLVPTSGDKVVMTIPGHGIALCETSEDALAGVLGVMAASMDDCEAS